MSKDSAGQVKRKKFRQAALLLPPAKDFAGPAKRPAAPMVPAAEESVRDSSPKKPVLLSVPKPALQAAFTSGPKTRKKARAHARVKTYVHACAKARASSDPYLRA